MLHIQMTDELQDDLTKTCDGLALNKSALVRQLIIDWLAVQHAVDAQQDEYK